MSRLSISLAAICLGANAAVAQTAASAPHTPAGEAVSLEHFVVTASPFERQQADLAQATTVLAGAALQQRQQATLGESLAGLPGLSSTYFGPGASRPVIRGLGGDRIRILENGAGTLDASVVSPDHAVSVEPFLIDRVEVVRGPASLLYGGSAVGGVVNVFTHRIESELPEAPISGLLEARAGSAAGERAEGGVVDVARPAGKDRALVLHLDGFRREADNVAIPGFPESAAVRAEETEHAEEHGAPPPVFARGELPNSALDSSGGAAGLSWVAGSSHAGFAWSGFGTNYGVPGHAHEGEGGVRIDLRQRRWDAQAESRAASGIFSGGRLKFAHADYEHRELEDGVVGTVFRNKGWEVRAEALHADLGGLAGTWGVQAGRNDLEALGAEAFLPPSRAENRALFVFEEFRRGRWTGEFGARYETQELAVRDGSGRGRDDDAASFSAGTVWNPAPGWTVAATVVRTQRAPNTQEVFAFGPHVGTNAFEIGDAALARERSTGFEASLRKRTGRVTGEVTVFANRFRGYIHERANGLVAVEGTDGFEFVDPGTLTEEEAEQALAVLEFVQTGAKFHGAEAEVLLHLHDEVQHKLDLRLAADITRAEDGAGRPLPRIPAARYTVGLQWQRGDWSAGAEWQRTAGQDRVALTETTSDGYSFVSAHVALCLKHGRQAWDIFVRGTNLTDEEARPHTSFLKDLAPLSGRNASAGVRWTF